MFLWNGFGTHEVVAGGNVYKAMGAVFGPASTSLAGWVRWPWRE